MKPVAFLLVLVLLAGSAFGFFSTVKVQSRVPGDEYVINSKLINDLFITEGVKLAVIHDQTSFFGRADIVEQLDKHLRRIQKSIPALSQDALNDFKAKNDHPYDLDKLFDLKVKYEFISRSEINQFFMGDDSRAWKSFYAKYPNSTGIIGVARVGFNDNMSQAFAYLEKGRSDSNVETFFVFLAKENGVWSIKKKSKASE
ncbi:MAG: hypothetical protein ACRD9S_03325 [Pyrinomonadaceae bacterium]